MQPEAAFASLCSPKVGLYFNEADLQRARHIIATTEWASKLVNEMADEASRFDRHGESWLAQMIPARCAPFAHGFRGCPRCKGRWDWFGEGICTWDNPLVLTCPSCHTRFSIDDQRDPFYDSGDGVSFEKQHYWLRGVWNAFVVDTLDRIMDQSALLWALTGDERHARRAAFLADHLATVCPTTIGPAELGVEDGRFHYLTSIVNRRKIRWAHLYDLLYHWPEFQGASPTNPGVSIAENVRQGLLLDYLEEHCAPRAGEWGNLHNHTSDTARAMLAVGWVLDIPAYVRTAAEIIPWFLENTVDGQGCYYETSAGYANFTREIFADMAVFLARMGVANYFDDPKFRALLDRPDDHLECAGHLPRYGDCPADHIPLTASQQSLPAEYWKAVRSNQVRVPAYGSYPYRLFDDRRLWTRHIATYASSPEVRDAARQAEAAMHSGAGTLRDLWDLTLRWRNEEPTVPYSQEETAAEASLTTHKGIAVLRSGQGQHRRALMLRFGPTLAHAHDDGLGLNIYGLGRDLSLDVGYDLYGRPMHRGWTIPRVSHNAVVVDQDLTSPRRGMRFLAGAGEAVLLATGEPPFQVVEAANSRVYAKGGVSEYSRHVALVDVDEEHFYFLDLFRVTGGTMHDYSFHATHPADGDVDEVGFATNGVHLQRIHKAWTLAGLDERWQNADFNQPGCSFGERTAPAGYIHPLPSEDPALLNQCFTPEPGNGYSYLHDLVGGVPTGNWWARWQLGGPDQSSLRLWMLEIDNSQVLSARAPTLYEKPFLRYCIYRHHQQAGAVWPLQSKFVAVIEPAAKGEEQVVSIEDALKLGEPQDAAVRVHLAGGRVDTILSGTSEQKELAAVGANGEPAILRGKSAAVRAENGRPTNIKVAAATSFQWGALTLEMPPAWEGAVIEVKEPGELVLAAPQQLGWPVELLAGEYLHISGGESAYGRTSVYRITEVSAEESHIRVKLNTTTFSLGRGRIKNLDRTTITSDVALPWGFPPQAGHETGSLTRKLLVGEESKVQTHIKACLGEKVLQVASTAGLIPGEAFRIYDVATGDRCRVQPWASLHRKGGTWEISANCKVQTNGLELL